MSHVAMSELIRQFGVDWRLLAAQAVNFGVLLFLLARFVYRPILAMLQKRREDIEKGILFTKRAEEELARVDVAAEEKLAEAREKAFGIVSQAEETAKIRGEEIAVETTKKSEAIVAASRRVIQQEKAKMSEAVYGEAEELVRAAVVTVLGKMKPAERDQELIREAITALKSAQ